MESEQNNGELMLTEAMIVENEELVSEILSAGEPATQPQSADEFQAWLAGL